MNRQFLWEQFGHLSTWFRAGTAHYDDATVRMCTDNSVAIAGFLSNIDTGATATAASVQQNLLAATDGAICLAHMNHPGSGISAGLRRAASLLRAEGTVFVTL